MKANSLLDLEEKLARAIEWLEEITETKVRGRLLRAKKIVRKASEAYLRSEDPASSGSNDFPAGELSIVLNDFISIVEIYDSLAADPLAPIFIGQLSEILNGADFPKDEKPIGSGSRARDFQFELIVTAMLSRAGFPPIHRSSTADGSHDLRGVTLFHECKRLKTLNAVKGAVREAQSQLRKAYKTSETTRFCGLIALDGSKLLNDGSKVFIGNERQARASLDTAGRRILFETKGMELDPEVLGILVLHMTPARINRRVTSCTEWTLGERQNLSPLLSKSFRILKSAFLAKTMVG